VFAEDALETLVGSIRELRRLPWHLFYLGGHAWGRSFEKAPGCLHLEIPRGLTCTHAIAYHESIYDRILADVPDRATGVALWLRKECGIDQYFSSMFDCRRLLTSPVVATQPSILACERRSFQASQRVAAVDDHEELPCVEPELTQQTFTIRAFGCSIQVIADCEEVLGLLQTYLLPSLPRTAPECRSREIVMSVVRRKKGFELSCDRVARTSADHKELIVEAIRLLDEAVVKRPTGLAAVHAGMVRIGGQAVLLPGGTNVGKSALVAELLRRGAEYLSDEYALIDADGQAHPYPRPLLLRNPGPEQVAALPEHWNARVPEKPVPVGWILALKYDPAANWSVTPVPQSEAILTLLRNTPHALIQEPHIFGAFERASSRARCYAGCRNDVRLAAESILQLVAS
jgi:hypothetical protein